MNKSRTGMTILFLVLITVAFIVVAAIVSKLLKPESETSTWADVLGYGSRVGVVKVQGTITSSDNILKQIRKFVKKPSVKAIVIRINSPGGAVAPAQEIYREIRKAKKKKPVVASMETVGASAAYYIASATDQIVCSKGTITGSIGVIMFLADLQNLVKKIGIGVNVIKAGKFKDIGSYLRPLTDEEHKILEDFAAQIHEQFIDDVAAGRKGKIDEAKLRTVADGRFFTGQTAKELGLVDTIGNFYDAVKIAGKRGGIKGEIKIIYPKKRWGSYFDMIFGSLSQAVTRTADQLRLIQRTPAIR